MGIEGRIWSESGEVVGEVGEFFFVKVYFRGSLWNGS